MRGFVCAKAARTDFLMSKTQNQKQKQNKKTPKKSKLTFYRETGYSSKTIKDSVIQNIPILYTLFTDFMKNASL